MRDTYVLTIVHCSRIYKEVLYKVAWSKRMLYGSTTNVSLGCVVFVPKNGVVLMRMFVTYSARVVAYVLTVYHCSVIYSPPLCNVLWSNSSWYWRNYIIRHGSFEILRVLQWDYHIYNNQKRWYNNTQQMTYNGFTTITLISYKQQWLPLRHHQPIVVVLVNRSTLFLHYISILSSLSISSIIKE